MGGDVRGEVGWGVGPDEGALARAVLDELDGHFFAGAGAEPAGWVWLAGFFEVV